jgi:predicted nucleotidyltransferase
MLPPSASAIRLSDLERRQILESVRRASAETGASWQRILLFGSRADASARGGDIDLLIEISRGGDAYRFKQRLLIALEDALGEQKIDLVIDDGAGSAFVALARTKGVELWSND